jgi:hypothetical protein
MLNAKQASRWLAAVVVMQGLILATLWSGGPAARPAAAQIPDAGAQQQQVIDQLKATNDKLDKLLDLLGSGSLQVRMGGDPHHAR